MSRRWLLSLLCLTVLFLSLVPLTGARGELRVNETGSSILFEKDPAEVLLAVENPSAATIKANVQLELLDPRNKSLARTTQLQSIATGSQKLKLSLPFVLPAGNDKERNLALWYRLHYRITPQESPAETLADGIISLSEMTPDLFELRVSATEIVREGNRYRVRVQTLHPVNQRPAQNVRVDAQVTLEGDNIVKLNDSGFTNAKGHAQFDFQLPARFPQFPHHIRAAGGELQVTGRKGALIVQTKGDVLVDQSAPILITTDKPLYQPSQVMHVRALVLTPSRRALANHDTYFKISDPEGALLYRSVVTTSRFGIASADWAIPENTRLGDYQISVGVDGGDEETTQNVTISRYELPNFRVKADPDRKFYLAGQNAAVTIRADYLFGQPVLRGKVRVVRETERRWNYREQKWDLIEQEEQKGETNADGAFVARFDLSRDHKEIDDYQRFRDITYAAYFTDPTTNRTEQRRFDLRVTRDPIHVYVAETYEWSNNRKLPLQFYVSTFYADGTPARCKVNVTFDDDVNSTKRVSTVTTNRYGLAKITTRLPKDFEDKNEVGVVLSAMDSSGRKGSDTEEFRFDDDPGVRVETDKTIYRPGEPVNAVITAPGVEGTIVVDLSGETGLLRSERVQLRGGRASITFPFRPEFRNSLSVVAYPESANSRSLIGTRTVLYPHNSELNVDARSAKDTYRPGEDAQLNFKVRSAGDRSEESVLGVVLMDQAVVERFRTDQDFGSGYNGYNNAIPRFLGLEDQLAGVSLRDLQRLNTSQPIASDLDLLAAVLLRNSNYPTPAFYSSREFEQDAASLFRDSIKDQLKQLKEVLADHYARTMKYPTNETELRSLLSQSKIDLNSLRDPWGGPLSPHFSTDMQYDWLAFWSNGADKRDDTPDDFIGEQISWPYFRPTGETIDRAITRYHQRTGRFIRDAKTLAEEVSTDGLNLDEVYDRWGQPYRLEFKIVESQFELEIRSGGPDKQFSKDPQDRLNDFTIWQSGIDYFAKPRAQIDAALTEHLNRTQSMPESDRELRQALSGLGDDFENLRDPWGRPYYSTFRIHSFYTDRVRLEQRARFGETPTTQTRIEPVKQTSGTIVLRSSGPDMTVGTADDFSVASFSGVISQQSRSDAAPVTVSRGVVLSGTDGTIVGVVTDPNGAVVAGTTVTAKNVLSYRTFETSTGDEGKYTFAGLPPGTYEVTFDAHGFQRLVVTNVTVRYNNITEVNAELEPGEVGQVVEVMSSSAPATLMTEASVNASRNTLGPPGTVALVTKSGSAQMSTPRLREYFPETLLWQPSVETDKNGRAQINFKLADNITTWNMIVIGSTEDGRIGTTEKEIRSFQPFFVEHDPPRVLTEGDEISLPVVVRNYLSKPQKVDLEIKPESWFSLLGPTQKQTTVIAGDATRETFDFRVTASVKDGKQRITARGSDDHDAIEKPVSVHPDGEELSATAGDVLDDVSTLELKLPQNLVPNSSRGELKIYPNLLAHVAESVEAIMERPYGCGEQTISSTYPSLLLLRHYRGESFPLRALAQRYLRDGYSRLLNYRAENGGFTYWGTGEPDVALTAYALQFLVDAGNVVSVDQDVVKQTRDWLVKQQQPDGRWRHPYSRESDPQGPNIVLTAYVARVLARTDAEVSEPLKRALDFLGRESQRIDEPHLLASYALASVDAKDMARAKPAIEKLRTLAVAEENTTYWTLETNTPFYGWGLAGRVETTALAVQTLIKYCPADCESDRKLINRGLLFLLKQKDRHGVWYSTQATVNVLDAMLLLFSLDRPGSAAAQSATDIVVNGNRVQSLPLNDRLNNPVTVDISQALRTGTNRVEIKRPKGLPFASVQAVANYYVSWSDSKPAGAKTDLRLQVKFDKTDAKINDEITCRVEAERVGFRGYGMMLAEIGIPPGAEVDRSSLQTALKNRTINQYDVLPDRVVVYLWPRAGGVSFNFKFRPRFGLKAKTAASTLYDYYNPEAAVVVAPSVFTVQ
ncbi:MAG TPA: alpha-2-macroglobulin family protein [Pyrinomonadaceae bacterium]|nr:alpha-2-macroglobulin family protein [Pyrinomonadaceae bacterium]